jgi:tetratricopeptide (TPR) repeat protein
MLELTLHPSSGGTATTLRRSLELLGRYGDDAGAAMAKVLLAQAELQITGPSSEGARLVAEAQAAFTAAGDRWGEAYVAIQGITFDTDYLSPPGRAEETAGRALERFAELDDGWGQALARYVLANVAKGRGDVGTAVARYEEAVADAREDGPLWLLCAALVELGGLVAVTGDVDRAVRLHTESADIARRAWQRRGLAYAWNGLGAIARSRGDLEHARRLHADALAAVREIVPWSVPFTLASLACAEARLGDLAAAEEHLRESARLLLTAPDAATAAVALAGQALVSLGRGADERAATFLAAAGSAREGTGVTPVGAERVEAELVREAVRDRLDPAALRAAQAAGAAMAVDEALAAVVEGHDAG